MYDNTKMREEGGRYLSDPGRLAALARTGLPDSEAEPSFDRLARLAAKFLGTPVALVSLVDADRQFFKSCVGLPEPWASRRETPLSHSFCQHVVTTKEPLIISDARLDHLVRDNPAVLDLGVIAYLGIPLAINGHVIGSFCAIDGKPRSWTADDVAMLGDLAESVVTEILLRAEHEEISRQRTAAEAARQRFHVTLSSIGDGVIATDARGAITFMNPVAQALCGCSEEEALGRPVETVFRIVRDQAHQAIGHPFAEALAGGMTSGLARRTILIANDGTERPVDDTAAPIKNAQGEVEGVVLVLRDIGERERLVEQLRQADERKDDFLAMLAHELRNPLAAITNASTLMTMSDQVEMTDYCKDTIRRQAKHLSRLIDDLLDVSRITHGKIDLLTDHMEATAAIDSAVQTVRPLAEERKHTLDVQLDRGNLWVNADATRLEQIVINLLNNAAKYSENGGHIRLSAGHEGDEIAIRVKDAGLGIPPEKLPEMFELFAQADRSSARSEGGLGIGLTLVKRLVEMHGGTITASSEGLGKGSEFVVRLPAATRPTAVASVNKGSGDAMPSARILVVDDNADTSRSMARLLKLMGHEVTTAQSGPEAIEAARAHPPEIVLLDIGLPGMDGYEVAKRLRQAASCEHAVIVAVSGYSQEVDRRHSLEAGFDHHLAKPVDLDALRGCGRAHAEDYAAFLAFLFAFPS